MNNIHEATDNQANAALESPPNSLFNSLTASDWQSAIGKSPTKIASEPSDGHLSFDNIYANPLAQNTAKLAGDSKALQGAKSDSGVLPTDTLSRAANSPADKAVASNKSQPEVQGTPGSAGGSPASHSTETKPASHSAEAKPTASDAQTATAGAAQVSSDLNQVNSAITDLKTDVQALAKAPHSAQDLSKVNADEATLKTDELKFMHASAASSTYADYTQAMAGNKAELKGIATNLWNMGQKADAGQTTAYYPTSNYEKYFNGSTGTGPGNPGGPTLKNETSDTNLQDDSWKTNLIAGEIGGKGINPNMKLSTSDGALTATMSGGAYTDGLISNTQKYNTNDNTVQMNYDATIKPGSDLHAFEMDEAITGSKQADGKVLTAMAASQFVMNPKTGTMEFDTSGTNHQWVDAVNNIPMPADGKMDVSMTVKMVGNSYEYTGLTVNGKTYDINSDASTFQSTQIGPKGWTPDTVHVQMQQDLGSAGGSSTVTYNDVQINQGNT
jgi:hypothetical protein